MPLELKDAIAKVAEYATDKAKAKELAEAMRDDPIAKEVSQHLINIGNGGKAAELDPKIKRLETDVRTANETIAAKDLEIEELGKKAPERKQIEEQERLKWEARMKKADEERDAAKAESKKLRQDGDLTELESLLSKPDQAGVFVEPEVAKLYAKEHVARSVEREDGTRDVLQLDSDVPYDGKDHRTKLAALAADVRKKVPKVALITSTDRGGGVTSGGGGNGSYDPVKAGTEMGKQGKSDNAQTGEKSLAYK